MKKIYILGTIVFGVFLLLALVSVQTAYAQETEMQTESLENSTPQETSAVSEDSLTEEEREVLLAQISEQLVEIEREVNELSLMVNKYVLERQALALQEELEQEQARLAAGSPSSGASSSEEPQEEAGSEADPEQEPAVAVTTPPSGETQNQQEQESQDPQGSQDSMEEQVAGQERLDDGAVSSTVDSAQQEQGAAGQQSGFIAGIASFAGNLGTPELVTIAILAFLAALILVRRFRDRRAPAKAEKTPQSTASINEQTSSQKAVEDSRQELKERVSWQ